MYQYFASFDLVIISTSGIKQFPWKTARKGNFSTYEFVLCHDSDTNVLKIFPSAVRTLHRQVNRPTSLGRTSRAYCTRT